MAGENRPKAAILGQTRGVWHAGLISFGAAARPDPAKRAKVGAIGARLTCGDSKSYYVDLGTALWRRTTPSNVGEACRRVLERIASDQRGVAHFFNQKHEPPPTPGTASTDRTSEPTCGAWRPRVFMPRSAANADRARTTCSGARSRACKVLSPSSQPRPRRPPAERRHLFSGVVIATVVPPGTCRPPETQPPTTAPPRSRNPRRPKGTAREPPCPRSSAARPRSRRCVSRRDNHAQKARDTRTRPAAPPAAQATSLSSAATRRKDSGVLFLWTL